MTTLTAIQARTELYKLLDKVVESILDVLKRDPFHKDPPCKKLTGDREGAYSRHKNIKHRLAYQIFKRSKTAKVIRTWTHYE